MLRFKERDLLTVLNAWTDETRNETKSIKDEILRYWLSQFRNNNGSRIVNN